MCSGASTYGQLRTSTLIAGWNESAGALNAALSEWKLISTLRDFAALLLPIDCVISVANPLCRLLRRPVSLYLLTTRIPVIFDGINNFLSEKIVDAIKTVLITLELIRSVFLGKRILASVRPLYHLPATVAFNRRYAAHRCFVCIRLEVSAVDLCLHGENGR